ncbi:hypothetical protein FHS55_003877 [Angulomicrobium tetraedrale]|uniref:Uncharacterized protein n=1 Tax=Ancylobacter tetraedralis TaxID=217068 RepID=A0A839ZEQ3_9HYPH|nr:hypothetical protein [Ancylobacter tetraedralis]MBB3773244.1 hypothetical protein [Ancylobacter tetraedralis]
MANLEHWTKADALNVYQIALLLKGLDPSPLWRLRYSSLPLSTQDATAVYVMLLTSAVASGTIAPSTISHYDNGRYDWDDTLISLDSLRGWLAGRDMKDTIFGPPTSARHTPAQKSSPFHAPKLAAALAAWEAVTSGPELLRGKSPKRALETWLTEHAAEYDLLNKDGTPNRTGIEEIAKVANWNQKGGAPTTPALPSEPSPSFRGTFSRAAENPPLRAVNWGEDDEIPF